MTAQSAASQPHQMNFASIGACRHSRWQAHLGTASEQHMRAQMLGRTSKWALGMRLRHLAVTGAESRTILVQVCLPAGLHELVISARMQHSAAVLLSPAAFMHRLAGPAVRSAACKISLLGAHQFML